MGRGHVSEISPAMRHGACYFFVREVQHHLVTGVVLIFLPVHVVLFNISWIGPCLILRAPKALSITPEKPLGIQKKDRLMLYRSGI